MFKAVFTSILLLMAPAMGAPFPVRLAPGVNYDESSAEATGQERGPLYVRAAMVYEGLEANHLVIALPALINAAESFVGKPVLRGHDWRDPDMCVGLIQAVGVREDRPRGHFYLEAILVVQDHHAITRILDGRYRSLSIGFVILEARCDQADYRDPRLCGHWPGRLLVSPTGVVTITTMNITGLKGVELSFINVPACEPARVLDCSFEPLKLR